MEANPFTARNYCISSSRGCPFSCTYCSNSAIKKIYYFEKSHVRRRSPQNVVEELEQAKAKYHIDNVAFFDEAFLNDLTWFESFARLYKEKIDLPYQCLGHPLAMRPSIAKLLKESGCYSIGVGFQTPIDRIRTGILNRKETREQIINMAAVCRQYEVHFSVDHIFGLPEENITEIQSVLEFYNQIRPRNINKYWLNFYPGTEIVEQARERGMLTDQEVEAIADGKLSFDYLQGGHLKRRPKIWKQTLKSAIFMELMLLLPKKISDRLISLQMYKALPGSYYGHLAAKAIRSIIYGHNRTNAMVMQFIKTRFRKIFLSAKSNRS